MKTKILADFKICLSVPLKLFQKDVKLETNQHANSILSDPKKKKLFISFTSSSFCLDLITKKYVSIEKGICFKKDLLVARDQ